MNTDVSWYVKYEADEYENLILPKGHRAFFDKIINDKALPNLLLHSNKPGVGKSSIAKILTKELNYEKNYINASVDGGIETIRTDIIPFSQKAPQMGKKGKLVILEEGDRTSFDFQKALLEIADSKSNTKYIITCNHLSKLDAALQDRFQVFNFDYTSAEDKEYMTPLIKARLEYILQSEGINYSGEMLDALIEVKFPSIRNMIKTLQNLVWRGNDLTDPSIISTRGDVAILDMIRDKKYKSLVKYLLDEDIDLSQIYTHFYDSLIPSVDDVEMKERLVLYLDKAQTDHQSKIDKELHIKAVLINVRKVLTYQYLDDIEDIAARLNNLERKLDNISK